MGETDRGKAMRKHTIWQLIATLGWMAVTGCGRDDQNQLPRRFLSDDLQQFATVLATADESEWPQTLSATGLFQSLQPLLANAAFIPYSINLAHWSSGSRKRRWLYAAEGIVRLNETSKWQPPIGSILIEHHESPRTAHPVETRIAIRLDSEWVWLSYLWNDAATDALLVPAEGHEELAVAGEEDFIWRVPARSECMTCHNPTTGPTLGLRTEQLNRTYPYANGEENQLSYWQRIGLIGGESTWDSELSFPASRSDTVAVISSWSEADLDHYVRSYLEVNCASCHVSQSASNPAGALDLSYAADPKHWLAPASSSQNGLPRLTPGEPENSDIWLRMLTEDETRMPPFAVGSSDEFGLSLLEAWIRAWPSSSADPSTAMH